MLFRRGFVCWCCAEYCLISSNDLFFTMLSIFFLFLDAQMDDHELNDPIAKVALLKGKLF